MNRSLVFRKKIFLFSFFLFSFVLFLYLFYFLVSAPRGIISHYKTLNQSIIYENELTLLHSINNELEDKISRLSPHSLDLDYLDEMLRFKIGSSSKNELVIVLDE